MTLNGIDISSHQALLRPASMVGTDFIIVKVSQWTWYTNPFWRRHADGTLKAGKLLGLYLYVGGNDPAGEARYFVDRIHPYLGKALLAVDWETAQNRAWGNLNYLEALTREVIRLTGVRPLIYTMAGALSSVRPVAQRLNCGLWVAQYASSKPVHGYQKHPWREGAYQCAIRQYSDNGRIPGYFGGLDLDIAYMGRAAWMRYAAVSGKQLPAPAQPKPVSKPVAHPQLTVDGYVGRDTIRLWQQRMGTPVDGIISGQVPPRGYTRPALTSYRYGGSGSALVKAVQSALNRQFPQAHLSEDGLLGPRTILYLHAHEGIQNPSTRPWTNFGRGLGSAIQRSLNKGQW